MDKKIKKMMTEKDKENFRKLADNEWPGKRAYNRLMKAAREGYLEIDQSHPEMKRIDDSIRKFGEKVLAKKARSKKK